MSDDSATRIDGTLYKTCSKCGTLHDRGKRYSYCRACQTLDQRERRKSRGVLVRRVAELEMRVSELERRTASVILNSQPIGARRA